MNTDRTKAKQASTKRRQELVSIVVFLYIVAITTFSVLSLVKCVQMRRDLERCLEMVEELALTTEATDEGPMEEPRVIPSVEYQELASVAEQVNTISTLEGTENAPEEAPEALRTITVTATAYCPCPSCCGVWSAQHPSRVGTDYQQVTACGAVPTEGRTIATDPSVIPTGTHVLINGHEYVAEDTGGAIKGNRIDIFFASHEAALNWGRQTVEVTILEE